MKRFRGGLVFKAHILLSHSTLGLRVLKKKKAHNLGEILVEHRLDLVEVRLALDLQERETSLLTTYWSESTLPS